MAAAATEKKLTDCYWYLQGQCAKTTTCEYRHHEAAIRNEMVCKQWIDRACSNPTCDFRHPSGIQKDRSSTVCYYFTHGGCMKGSSCPFSHSAEIAEPAELGKIEAIKKAKEEELRRIQEERIKEEQLLAQLRAQREQTLKVAPTQVQSSRKRTAEIQKQSASKRILAALGADAEPKQKPGKQPQEKAKQPQEKAKKPRDVSVSAVVAGQKANFVKTLNELVKEKQKDSQTAASEPSVEPIAVSKKINKTDKKNTTRSLAIAGLQIGVRPPSKAPASESKVKAPVADSNPKTRPKSEVVNSNPVPVEATVGDKKPNFGVKSFDEIIKEKQSTNNPEPTTITTTTANITEPNVSSSTSPTGPKKRAAKINSPTITQLRERNEKKFKQAAVKASGDKQTTSPAPSKRTLALSNSHETDAKRAKTTSDAPKSTAEDSLSDFDDFDDLGIELENAPLDVDGEEFDKQVDEFSSLLTS